MKNVALKLCSWRRSRILAVWVEGASSKERAMVLEDAGSGTWNRTSGLYHWKNLTRAVGGL